MVPEIWCATDGWTNGQMEKVTYRGASPKKTPGDTIILQHT